MRIKQHEGQVRPEPRSSSGRGSSPHLVTAATSSDQAASKCGSRRERPVVKVVPCVDEAGAGLEDLRGTVTRFIDPTEPVAVDEWDALK